MMARTSARSSGERSHASSPAKATRTSQSPAVRRTRTTRSASVELGNEEINTAMSTRRNTRRGARETSVESAGSGASNDSRAGRRRRPTRAVAAAHDLSVLHEASETVDPKGAEDDDDDDEDEDVDETNRRRTSKSPDNMSQISGTTANTTHSSQEIADMNAIRIIEYLPELHRTAYELLVLLAPQHASKEEVEKIIRELQVPGTPKADRLRLREHLFNHPREAYGSEQYIRPVYILRKLLKTSDPGEGNFRLDAILHVANLARMVKDLLVTPRDTQNALFLLQALDIAFPGAFLTKFDTEPLYGKSMMIDETFEMGLQIRTQTVILSLMSIREDPRTAPDELLVDTFYQAPSQRDERLSLYDDSVRNGHPKEIAGMGEDISPAKRDVQNKRIVQRMGLIRSAFISAEDSTVDVDFDRLDELFPWSIFLTDAVRWSRSRLGEIEQSIKTQGGVESIQKSLADTVHKVDPEINLTYDQPLSLPEPRQLLPAPNITPAAKSNSKSFFNPANLRMIEAMKASGDIPPSNQTQKINQRTTVRPLNPSTPVPTASAPLQYASEPPRGSRDAFYAAERKNSTSAASSWKGANLDKNKENRPTPERAKRHFLDAQQDRYRISFDDDNSHDDEEVRSNHKRSRGDSEDSEDDDFQTDRRTISRPRKRVARAAPQQATPEPTQERSRSRRTQRQVPDDGPEPVRRRRGPSPHIGDDALQASVREQESDEERNDQLQLDEIPFSQVAELAKLEAIRSKSSSAKKRIKWSDKDSARLIELIENIGCSWSKVKEAGGFEVERDQVALKDKARNIKVSYLRAGFVLPRNFNRVALGKKEIAAVKAVKPDWSP